MNTFNDVIDYYRICKVCKSDDCFIKFINNNGKEVQFDFVKDYLRILYTRKLIKINLQDNKIICTGYKCKSLKFPKIKIRIDSECLNCGTIFNSNYYSLDEKLKPKLFKIAQLHSSKVKGKYNYIVNFSYNVLCFTKRQIKSYKDIYSHYLQDADLSNIDIDKLIDKFNKLNTFA